MKTNWDDNNSWDNDNWNDNHSWGDDHWDDNNSWGNDHWDDNNSWGDDHWDDNHSWGDDHWDDNNSWGNDHWDDNHSWGDDHWNDNNSWGNDHWDNYYPPQGNSVKNTKEKNAKMKNDYSWDNDDDDDEYNFTNNRVAEETEINGWNINTLKPAWKINTSMPVSSQPIVYRRDVYFTDWGGYAYCVNFKTGKAVWKVKIYDVPTDGQATDNAKFNPPYVWQGLAATGIISNGIWYIATVGGRPGEAFKNFAPGKLYALDIRNKKIKWSVTLTKYPLGGVLGKLLVSKGLVYVGLCSVDEPAMESAKELNIDFTPKGVGEVIAFNAENGRQVWSTKTIGLLPNDNINAVGAAVWNSFAIDNRRNILYFTTGNNYSEPISKSANAIIALNSKNGRLLWQQQIQKGQVWLLGTNIPQDGFGAGPQLFQIKDTNNNRSIPVVGLGSKNGYYYVFHRVNGSLIWKNKVFAGENPGSGICGEASIKYGRIYLWSNNGWNNKKGENPSDYPITTACLDANTGKILWKQEDVQAANRSSAGNLSKDVYFVGDLSGGITAYCAYDGSVLWNGKIKGASISSDITVYEDTIFVGTGVPTIMGGSLENTGLYSYKISGNYDKYVSNYYKN